MFDFIPLPLYEPIFDIFILISVMWVVFLCQRGIIFNERIVSVNSLLFIFVAVAIILYMGMRNPWGTVFGDTTLYTHNFMQIKKKGTPFSFHFGGEWAFNNLMNYFVRYSDIKTFYTLCAAIYVGSLWIAMRRIFKNYYFIAFLIICSMFTFWAYGVNGIRNGMGASVFILAMTFANTPVVMVALIILALGFHNSIWIMVAAASISWIWNSSKTYLIVWIACLFFSFFAGSIVQNYLATFDFISGTDRYANYLTGNDYVTGFRFDFVIYSAMGVIAGYYFIFRREMEDEYYKWIYNIYLLCNAFWILIIRSSYTNRFAQISWFILPVVLIYPFLKERHWVNHERMVAIAILLIFAFTFVMNTLPSIIKLIG